jgi:hypothetical protein
MWCHLDLRRFHTEQRISSLLRSELRPQTYRRGRQKRLFFPLYSQTISEAHPTSYSKGTRGFFLRVTRPGREVNHPHPSSPLVYKTILKLIWTCGIQLWGSASTSNIEILGKFQSKVLRMIVDAPWYVPNAVISHDLRVISARQRNTWLQCHLPSKNWLPAQQTKFQWS